MTAAQLRENAALVATLESHKRQGIPITTPAFLARLIEALKVKA